jgi:hypothetical protein
MSTPTIIHAHIVDELIDGNEPDVLVSTTADHLAGSRSSSPLDSTWFSRAVNVAGHAVRIDGGTQKAAVKSSENRVAGAGKTSLEDFGGRSDALGG